MFLILFWKTIFIHDAEIAVNGSSVSDGHCPFLCHIIQDGASSELTEYDEGLVGAYFEKIMVYDDLYEVIFKSGISLRSKNKWRKRQGFPCQGGPFSSFEGCTSIDNSDIINYLISVIGKARWSDVYRNRCKNKVYRRRCHAGTADRENRNL